MTCRRIPVQEGSREFKRDNLGLAFAQLMSWMCKVQF